MISSIFFIGWRLVELFFLIPMLGMLSYIIQQYVRANIMAPSFVLVIFIVTVIASVWVLMTTLFFHSAKRSGIFLALVDLAFLAAFIASVAVLRRIAPDSCGSFALNPAGTLQLQAGPFVYELGKFCNLLKASFALAIMQIFFFATTVFFALLVRHHHRNDDKAKSTKHHSSRHSRRRSSRAGGSRSRSRAPSRSASTRRGDSRSRSRYEGGSDYHYNNRTNGSYV